LETKRPAEEIKGNEISIRVGVSVQSFRAENHEGRQAD